MIRELTIERFKSIKSLSLPCRKVNVFIGAPDTGKTNILEALYLLSRLGWGWPLDTSLRLRQEMGFDALFYRQFFDKPFEIKLRTDPMVVAGNVSVNGYHLKAFIEGQDRRLRVEVPPFNPMRIGFGGTETAGFLDWVRFYSYTSSEQWTYNSGYPRGETQVTVPHGWNLLYIARHNQNVYEFLRETAAALNLRLRFDQGLKTFRLAEVRGQEIIDYNLDLLSDSLKRLFFYSAILLSSENSTLVFDEPDVFAFPPYPKILGEMIADDTSNQFFLTTHNPYLLAALLGKTPAADIALFVCYRDSEGATKAKLLSPTEVSKVIEQGASVFFNLEDFVGS